MKKIEKLREGLRVRGIIKDLKGYDPMYVMVAGYRVGDKFSGFLTEVQDENGKIKWSVQEKEVGGLFGVDLDKLTDIEIFEESGSVCSGLLH